ncbi:MAG: PKD domain-containing protein [Bacteroidetes bacterium]|nr:PKD domain-containing protein [Bacteroidota bacterium]
MKLHRRQLISIAAFCACMGIAHLTFTYSNSSPPASYTGAPSESSCTSCHSGTVITSGTEHDSIKLFNGKSTLEYIPDSTYHMSITFYANNQNKYGFQVVALLDANNRNAGSFTITNSSKTSKLTKVVSGAQRQYVTHTSGGVIGSNGSIKWDFDWTAPSTNVGDITFYVAVNNSNRNGQSSGDKVYEKSFSIKPSSRLPVASISSNKTTTCVGDTVTFTASATNNPTGYNWNFQSGTPSSSNSQTAKVFFSKSGTFDVSLIARNALGSSASKTIKIKVNGSPGSEIDSSGNLTFCNGDSVTLTALFGTSWKWSNGSTDKSIVVKNAGTYKLTSFANNGCSSESSPVEIKIHQRIQPSIQLISNDSICETDSIQILTDNRLSNYQLIRNSIVLPSRTDDIAIEKRNPGNYNYQLIGLDLNGCSTDSSNALEVHVDAQPAAPTIACDNVTADFLSFKWNDVSNADGYEISLDSGKTWTASSGLEHSINGLTFSTEVMLQARAKANGPCSLGEIATKVCKTNSCFKVRYDLDFNDTLCVGDTVKLAISNLNLSHYSVAYNDGNYSQNLNFELQINANTDLKLSFIDSLSLSCNSEDTVLKIAAFNEPNIRITNSWPVTENDSHFICISDSYLLQVDTLDAQGRFTNWSWSGNGVKQIGNEFWFNALNAQEGWHELVYSAENIAGCTSLFTEQINVVPTVIADYTYTLGNDGNVDFNASGNADSYNWNFGDGNTAYGKSVSHQFSSNGDYLVELTGTQSPEVCPSLSYSETIAIGNANIIGIGSENIKVYPNPSNGLVILENASAIDVKVMVFNSNGQLLLQKSFTGKSQLDLQSFEPGVYFFTFQNDNGISRKMVILED